jgi:hypothetical protein
MHRCGLPRQARQLGERQACQLGKRKARQLGKRQARLQAQEQGGWTQWSRQPVRAPSPDGPWICFSRERGSGVLPLAPTFSGLARLPGTPPWRPSTRRSRRPHLCQPWTTPR